MKFAVEKGSFRYSGEERQVLREISFSLESSDVLAILGPNGAGKTTLLRCSLGLLQWKDGRTLLDGEDLRQIKPRSLWQKIAYVPQAGQTAAPYTVEEMILLGRSSHFGPFSSPGAKDLEQLERVTERLGFGHLRKKKYNELSGGEKQLVLIGRALAAQPQVLVLDEPESNLDFRNQLLVLDVISELAGSGIACLFNTHYPAHALRRANKALMLGRDGSYVFGPVGEVVTEENISRYFQVSAMIGEFETPGNTYQDVIPLSPGETGVQAAIRENARVVASLSIILPDRTHTEKVNALIHTAMPWVIGRMGMPHPGAGLYLIHLILDGPASRIGQLTRELNLVPGVSVKATYAKEISPKEEQEHGEP